MRPTANSNVIFDVPNVFKVQSLIGQGAYGAVCKALYEGEPIAIKKIPFYTKGEDTARHVLREIEVLQNLQFCQQVIGCHLIFRPTSGEKDVYVAMDFIPSDLSSVIKDKAITMDEPRIRYITAQLLLALRALHKANTLHRDVSTRNVLINADSQVYLCDFGLSRFFNPDEQLSFGVVTQWYRAPEIILDAEYSFSSDVWSVGVILGEMLLRGHLFPGPSNDSAEQLKLIFNCVGTPKPELFNPGNALYRASANAKTYALSHITRNPTSSKLRAQMRKSKALSSYFTGDAGVRDASNDPPVIDLIVKLLSFDPTQRPSAHDALNHPWFEECGDFIDEEKTAQDNATIDAFTESQNMTMTQLVDKIEELVAVFSQDLLVVSEDGDTVEEG